MTCNNDTQSQNKHLIFARSLSWCRPLFKQEKFCENGLWSRSIAGRNNKKQSIQGWRAGNLSQPDFDLVRRDNCLLERGMMISRKFWKNPLSYMLFLTTTSTSLSGDLRNMALHLFSGGFLSLLIPLILAFSAAELALASFSFLCQLTYSCHLKVCFKRNAHAKFQCFSNDRSHCYVKISFPEGVMEPNELSLPRIIITSSILPSLELYIKT